MRRKEDERLVEVICNKCGKSLKLHQEIVQEGDLEIQADWGYFSEKDGEIHCFDLCEQCYDEWVATFKIPIDIVSKLEML